MRTYYFMLPNMFGQIGGKNMRAAKRTLCKIIKSRCLPPHSQVWVKA